MYFDLQVGGFARVRPEASAAVIPDVLAYHHAFDKWRKHDGPRLCVRIETALSSLYALRKTLLETEGQYDIRTMMNEVPTAFPKAPPHSISHTAAPSLVPLLRHLDELRPPPNADREQAREAADQAPDVVWRGYRRRGRRARLC